MPSVGSSGIDEKSYVVEARRTGSSIRSLMIQPPHSGNSALFTPLYSAIRALSSSPAVLADRRVRAS